MIDRVLNFLKQFIPRSVFSFFQPMYHFVLAWAAAAWYGFPSRRLTVIGVTGTNGKSTVVALLHAIFQEAGISVASISSLRFRIDDFEEQNMLKMTMPGRFAIQKFLHRAVRAGCMYAVVEVTSEGIKQFRHVGIRFAAAVLTNVTPEHIESHGGFTEYRAEKAKLFYSAPIHVLNGEDHNLDYFSKIPAHKRVVYTTNSLPANFHSKFLGDFNDQNMAAAYATARTLGVNENIIQHALENFEGVPGRLEFVAREPFSVVVDYAHTPDALLNVYETLRPGKTSDVTGTSDVDEGSRLICVLGSAGGGRDKWKRPKMGRIAAEYCDEIILTNEDPYDENPNQILSEIESGISNPDVRQLAESGPRPKASGLQTILDRREAISAALGSAHAGDVVIITGKGAEPWMMLARGKKIAWDDCAIVREELKNLTNS